MLCFFQDEDIWRTPTGKQSDSFNLPSTSSVAALNTSNILDHTSAHILNRVTSSNWTDLPTMLSSLGLERYINVFTTHEIDLTTFSTLTDQDLIEIGINAFGARRKILLAISGRLFSEIYFENISKKKISNGFRSGYPSDQLVYKMLNPLKFLVSELNKRSSSFSAAPGAERKSSSSSNSTLSPRENNW